MTSTDEDGLADGSGRSDPSLAGFAERPDAVRGDEALLRQISDALPVYVARIGPDLRYRYVNQAYEALFRVPREQLVGKTVVEVIGEATFKQIEPAVQLALAGRPATAISNFQPSKLGEARVMRLTLVPQTNAAGEPDGYVALTTDITEDKHAEAERAVLLERERGARHELEVAQQRLAILALVGERLAGSLEVDKLLAAVADALVPALADWCLVDVVEGDRVRRAAVTYGDPSQREVADLLRGFDAEREGGSLAARVLASGEAALIADAAPELMEPAPEDGDRRDRLRAMGVRSCLAVPLSNAGHTLGVITLAMAGSGRRFGGDDFRLAQEVARRAAAAVDNGRLYTAAQNAREEADKQRQRLHAIFMSAPAAISIQRGPEQFYVLANPRYRELFGNRELLDKTIAEVIPDREGQGYLKALDQVWRSGEPLYFTEAPVTLARDDGKLVERFYNFIFQPFVDGNGQPEGIITFGYEVTEQVLARQRLEAAQAARSILLASEQAARSAAEKANLAKDEFLAMLGHELRNPLAPIVTAVQLLKLRGPQGVNKEHEIIERHVGHVVRLVDDLLDISRITRGKITLKKESVDLGDVVAKAVEIASPLLEERRHQLAVDAPRGMVYLDADPVRLAQVIANLLTNAGKYTPPEGHVHVIARRQGDEAVIRVRDDGMGMSPELLPRIFDLFEQGQRASDRAEGGLGIGLTLVRSLLRMHGGSVSAHSDGVGRGSEFTVRLPALDTIPLLPEPPPVYVPAPKALHPRRVLVVDDNEDAADLLAALLRRVGHEVAVAHDGPGALRVVEGFSPQVGVLDIGLPVMDGYELAHRLQERLGPSCRLIALSGYGQDHDRERSSRAGFEAHLVKPLDTASLLAAIDR